MPDFRDKLSGLPLNASFAMYSIAIEVASSDGDSPPSVVEVKQHGSVSEQGRSHMEQIALAVGAAVMMLHRSGNIVTNTTESIAEAMLDGFSN